MQYKEAKKERKIHTVIYITLSVETEYIQLLTN